MPFRRITYALGLAFLALALGAPFAVGKKKSIASAASQMGDHQRAVHALNRLTFGPTQGEVDRVQSIGVDQWIDQQLHPEKIDDSALDARLALFPTLRMSSREIAANFPSEQLVRQVRNGKVAMPADPEKKAIYESQIARLDEKRERKQESTAADAASADTNLKPAMLSDESRKDERAFVDAEVSQLFDLPPEQRMQVILKLNPDDMRTLARSIKGDNRDRLLEGLTPEQRETFQAITNPQQVVDEELLQGKLLRSVYSQRQLQEVMTDFWFNHFNVYIGKGADHELITSYERDVIRPRALGKFEDLLIATAQSPAMLFYLDNGLSVGPNSDVANGIPKRDGNDWKKRARQNGSVKQSKGKRTGLNENYGRELMELHTLGVNGGYTQADVTELARVLTGWTIQDLPEGGGFYFDERKHEPGDKILLGHKIKPNGEKEGLEALHILAHHPATAHFISLKLAIRFVSDTPPPALVDRMAQTFLKKDGDVREVLKTMLQSPEFWSADAYRAKVKTPLEFTVSALRATGAEITNALPVVRRLQNMGMPLYGMQPPTGYSMKADAWVNSSALLDRMNFALALSAGKMRGVRVESASLLGANAPVDPEPVLAILEARLLDSYVSTQTHATIESRLQDPKITQRKLDDPSHPPNVALITGLLLGSPDFQRR